MSAGRALSLRGRLWLAGAVGVLLTAMVAGWLLGEAFRRASEGALDRRLQDDLATVAGLVEASGDGGWRLRREPADERYAAVFSGWYWQVGGPSRRVASRSLWDADIVADAGDGAPFALGAGPRGQSLRVHRRVLRLPGVAGPVPVMVAGDRADIEASVREFRWLATLAVAAAALLLLSLLAWQVEWGLRPLRRMRAVLASVRSGEDARFGGDGWPAEVAPLAAQFDDLLDEYARRVERARHAAQDLAHELKTPLSVLAAESERPGAGIAAVVADQVARMRAAVDRRLATGFAGDARQRTPIVAEIEGLLAMFRQMPRVSALRFSARGDDAVFAGSREDFVEMLGNLLDNAAKWAKAEVLVQWHRERDALVLEVRDDGPGIAEARLADVLQRGVRLDERMPGSGLGLSIVDAIASSYGGALQVRNRDEGFAATLRLPAAGGPSGALPL